MNGQFAVVKREAIPAIRALDENAGVHELGEIRDLRSSGALRKFLQNAAELSVSWAVLRHGEVLKAKTLPVQSIVAIYAGAGEVFGDLCRPLTAGDILVVPAGCSHGLIGGPESMNGVTIQLGRQSLANPEKLRTSRVDDESSLQALVAYNEERLTQFTNQPIFELLASSSLEIPEKRQAFISSMQIWLEGHLSMLIARQAGCRSRRYEPVFLKHLQQAMNGKAPRPCQTRRTLLRDPRMEAFTGWFVYQMSILDDAEKAAILNFVVEGATRALVQQAAPVLNDYVGAEYFKNGVRNNEHMTIAMELLGDEYPKTYARLRQIVGEAWDMVGAMTDRVVELTRTA